MNAPQELRGRTEETRPAPELPELPLPNPPGRDYTDGVAGNAVFVCVHSICFHYEDQR